MFGKKDYERKFFSDETNLSFVRCFLDNAKCDPLTGEVGKTIMFAVSRRHATKLAQVAQRGSDSPLAEGIRRRLDIRDAGHVGYSRRAADDD